MRRKCRARWGRVPSLAAKLRTRFHALFSRMRPSRGVSRAHAGIKTINYKYKHLRTVEFIVNVIVEAQVFVCKYMHIKSARMLRARARASTNYSGALPLAARFASLLLEAGSEYNP